MAEHAHSCCTLLAQKKFYQNGKWHTWIDFDRFHELVHKYEHDGTEFDSTDYMVETPDWALKGSEEQGFDPVEVGSSGFWWKGWRWWLLWWWLLWCSIRWGEE